MPALHMRGNRDPHLMGNVQPSFQCDSEVDFAYFLIACLACLLTARLCVGQVPWLTVAEAAASPWAD